MYENEKRSYVILYAKNWLVVLYLPTNPKNALDTSKKYYCDINSGYQRYPIYYRFIPNAFLGKVMLSQGKIIKKTAEGGGGGGDIRLINEKKIDKVT